MSLPQRVRTKRSRGGIRTTLLIVAALLILGFFALRFSVQREARIISVRNLRSSGAEITFHDATLFRVLSGGFNAKEIVFDFSDESKKTRAISSWALAHVRAFDEIERIAFVNCTIDKDGVSHIASREGLTQMGLIETSFPENGFDEYLMQNPECKIEIETPK